MAGFGIAIGSPITPGTIRVRAGGLRGCGDGSAGDRLAKGWRSRRLRRSRDLWSRPGSWASHLRLDRVHVCGRGKTSAAVRWSTGWQLSCIGISIATKAHRVIGSSRCPSLERWGRAV